MIDYIEPDWKNLLPENYMVMRMDAHGCVFAYMIEPAIKSDFCWTAERYLFITTIDSASRDWRTWEYRREAKGESKMKKIKIALIAASLLTASASANAGIFGDFFSWPSKIIGGTVGDWISDVFDRGEKNEHSVTGSTGGSADIVSAVPELDPAYMLGTGVVLIGLRFRRKSRKTDVEGEEK